MKRMKKFIVLLFGVFGFNIKKFVYSFRGIPHFFTNYMLIRQELHKKNQTSNWKISFYPCLTDRFETAGSMSGHYFHQDLIVAKKIYENKPIMHVDIGSRIDGLIAHLACFREVEIFDIRKIDSKVENILFKQLDCSSENFELENYCDSISSLHALEHFGLGRYGDNVDIDGHIKGLNNIYKALKPGGIFYFSVPMGGGGSMGKQRIEFDAHRVFSIKYLINLLNDKYDIQSFSYVDDKGNLHKDVALNDKDIQTSYNCNYGCAIFELIKK